MIVEKNKHFRVSMLEDQMIGFSAFYQMIQYDPRARRHASQNR